jgi:hypothetical protein
LSKKVKTEKPSAFTTIKSFILQACGLFSALFKEHQQNEDAIGNLQVSILKTVSFFVTDAAAK